MKIPNLICSILAITLSGYTSASPLEPNKTVKATECKALAMSGGGAKGAYEAGVLWGLVMSSTEKSKFAYDVVTGVSAGAINTGAISVYAPGDETNMVQFLSNKWATMTDDDVYQQWWPFSILTGINSETGIFDS